MVVRISAVVGILALAAFTVSDAVQDLADPGGLTPVVDASFGLLLAAAGLAGLKTRWVSAQGLRLLILIGVIMNIPPFGQRFTWTAYELAQIGAILASCLIGLVLLRNDRVRTAA